MWWKKNKWKVIIPVVIAAILAAAFWFGGSAPGLQGLPEGGEAAVSAPETPVAQEEPAVSPAPAPEEKAPDKEPDDAIVTPEKPAAPENPAPEPEEPEEEKPEEPPEDTGSADEKLPEEKPQEEEQASEESPAEPPEETEEPSAEHDLPAVRDRYMTDPVPEGRPAPVEPQDVKITDVPCTCTISISCSTILDNMNWLDPEKTELVPPDGWILKPVSVTFYEGESVFNVLQRVCKQQKIHMEFENTPMYNSAYIEGINNLYEFDCGEKSGWMYKVNDWFPNYGSSR